VQKGKRLTARKRAGGGRTVPPGRSNASGQREAGKKANHQKGKKTTGCRMKEKKKKSPTIGEGAVWRGAIQEQKQRWSSAIGVAAAIEKGG